MATLRGGEGNDSITGTSSADVIDSRDGNDVVYGLAGNDKIIGGAGNDKIYGSDGDDSIYGYKYWEYYSSSPDLPISIDIVYGGNGNDRILTLGSDFIDGGEGDDYIFQYGQNLTLEFSSHSNMISNSVVDEWGQDYFDLLFPTTNATPTIYGGGGNDKIFVNKAQLLTAGDGDDFVVVADVNNSGRLDGGNGNDTLVINQGGSSDTYTDQFGTFLNHQIEFSNTFNFEKLIISSLGPGGRFVLPDSLNSGSQIFEITLGLRGRMLLSDTIYIDASNESISSYSFKQVSNQSTGSQKMIIISGNGDDVINGDFLDDILQGGSGNDSIFGGEGNDLLTGGIGNDYIEGGDGVDTGIYSGNYADYTIAEITYNTFSIKGNVGTDGTDTIIDVNKLQFADQTIDVVIRGMEIIGDDAVDSLIGGSHADHLDGAGGNDNLSGLAGNDLIDGGTGNDKVTGGVGNDYLNGESGDDLLYGGDGNDVVDAGEGNDVIIGGDGKGNDTYNGGIGIDTIKYSSATAAITVDLTQGTATSTAGGDAAMIGTDKLKGIENIIAGNYNDTMKGNNASNTLNGGLGADTLYGGLGQDLLYGGSDTVRDVFDFNTVTESKVGSTRDKIYNFVTGKDDIDLSGIDANTKASGNQAFKFGGTTKVANGVWYEKSGADLLVHADINGDKVSDMDIQLVGVSKLVAADFVL